MVFLLGLPEYLRCAAHSTQILYRQIRREASNRLSKHNAPRNIFCKCLLNPRTTGQAGLPPTEIRVDIITSICIRLSKSISFLVQLLLNRGSQRRDKISVQQIRSASPESDNNK